MPIIGARISIRPSSRLSSAAGCFVTGGTDAGAAAARQAIPQIRQIMRHGKLFSRLRPSLGRRLAELHLESDILELCAGKQSG